MGFGNNGTLPPRCEISEKRRAQDKSGRAAHARMPKRRVPSGPRGAHQGRRTAPIRSKQPLNQQRLFFGRRTIRSYPHRTNLPIEYLGACNYPGPAAAFFSEG